MEKSKECEKNSDKAIVEKCKADLSKYFHPQDLTLTKRFEFIYRIFGLSDDSLAQKIGIDKSTMNRYRRGIFIPTTDMKILIAKAISELADYPIDTSIIWGQDLIFVKWRRTKEGVDNEI